MALAARVYFCFGLALIVLHLAVGGSHQVYEILGLTSVAAVLAGIWAWHPRHRAAWLGIAVAQTLFWLGDIVYQKLSSPTFPAVPDGLYLTSYCVFLVSLLLMMGREFPWRDWEGHLDAALITLCF